MKVAPTRGEPVVRADLCTEAIVLHVYSGDVNIATPPSEVSGLVALMLLHDSRRRARLDAAGSGCSGRSGSLEVEQDYIAEALPLVAEALKIKSGSLR
jgi:RNA polymerase sigma-70 factor (ECF subfamily)